MIRPLNFAVFSHHIPPQFGHSKLSTIIPENVLAVQPHSSHFHSAQYSTGLWNFDPAVFFMLPFPFAQPPVMFLIPPTLGLSQPGRIGVKFRP